MTGAVRRISAALERATAGAQKKVSDTVARRGRGHQCRAAAGAGGKLLRGGGVGAAHWLQPLIRAPVLLANAGAVRLKSATAARTTTFMTSLPSLGRMSLLREVTPPPPVSCDQEHKIGGLNAQAPAQ